MAFRIGLLEERFRWGPSSESGNNSEDEVRAGWDFAHSLIAHWLIAHSFFFSKSLILLRAIHSDGSGQMNNCERIPQVHMTNERPWANRSGRSWQKSDCERFTQGDHDKRANEQIAHSLFCSQKKSDLLSKIWLNSYFFVRLFHIFFKLVIRSFPLF